MDGNGNPVMRGGQAGTTFSGLDEYSRYYGQACATNGFGAVATAVLSAFTWTSAPSGPSATYTVDTNPSRRIGPANQPSGLEFLNYTAPDLQKSAPPAHSVLYWFTNGPSGTSNFSLSSETDPGAIGYRFCFLGQAGACSASSPVTPATLPTTVTMNVPTACTPTPSAKDVTLSRAVESSGAYKVDVAPDLTTNQVVYTITFSGAYSALGVQKLYGCLVPAPTAPDPGGGDAGGGATTP
jgi:hypothetical protein